jgi:hypothetical protein
VTEKMQIEVGANVGGAVTGLRQVGTELKKIAPQTNAGTRAFTDFGRVLQDLPFGPTGVANNLEGIALSMRNVREQAKATGTSVASILVKSLAGGGGLLLALSAVSFALTIAQSGLSSWTRLFGGAKKSVDDVKKSIEEYTDLLSESTKELASNQTQVTSLFAALNSGTLNTAEKKEALKDLKQINSEYFGALKEENGIIVGLEAAYKGYISALKEIGKTKAIELQLTKLFNEKLQLELQIDPKFNASTSKQVINEISALERRLSQIGGQVKLEEIKKLSGFEIAANKTLSERIRLTQKIQSLQRGETVFFNGDSFNATSQRIEDINRQIEGLSSLLQTSKFDIKTPEIKGGKGDKKGFDFLFDFFPFDPSGNLKPDKKARVLSAVDNFSKEFRNIFAGVDFRVNAKDDDSAIKAAKVWWDNYKNGIVKFAQSEGLEVDVKLIPGGNIEATPEEAAALRKQYIDGLSSELNKEGQPPIIITPEIQADLDKFRKQVADAKKLRESIQQSVNDAAQGISVAAFVGVGEAIAAAMTSGDVGSVFEQLGQTIGAVVQQLGQQMIALSPIIQALKLSIRNLSPVGMIAAGVGLVALGGVIKNATKVKGFAAGGLVTGSTVGMIGEGIGTSRSNPEVISPLDKLKNMLGDVGGRFPNYLPAFELRGDTLRAWYAKANKMGGQFI